MSHVRIVPATATHGTAPPPRPRPAPTWWVWLAAWPVTAVFVLSNAATPLYVLWQREIGFSKGTLTVVFALYIVGLLVSLLVSGVASDRLGRKAVLLPALALALIACLVFATATSVAALAVARVCTGIAVGAVVSAGMAAVTDVAGAHRKRLAALLASCAMVFGAGLGPLLAGVFAETLPGPTVTVFVVEAALLLTAAVTVLRMPLGRPARVISGRWIRVPSVPAEGRLPLLLGIATFGPGITATSFVLSLGPSLLAGLLHSSSRVLAGVTAFVMFAAATGTQFAVQRVSRRTVLTAAAVCTVAAMAALAGAMRAGSVVLLVAAALLAGAGQGMGQLAGLSLLNAAVPATRLAEANAALNVGGYVPAGLLPVAAGYLSDAAGLTTGSTIFAAVLAALALAGGVVVMATRRRIVEPG
ncbi:MFS transporter [Microbispora hainanensis]|uniref:MFS transporter n=1 Tax=Microbispora hainanensis TaxID=568844 RepID=A0ABZ1SWA4_9ACTN|nr:MULTISPECIES: MFS transporter [Microbispora]NJP22899.1 MFS transporter [Microbispora sp. CL1-1]TQS16924.1 MFS transporter [Microbispora sp. SCL1-1]